VGPLINTRGARRVSALVKDALGKGAKALTGDGAILGPNGTLLRPAVLTDVTTDMGIFASEIFGPATALDVDSRVRSGIIHINDQGIGDEPMAPFGGVKNSGYGKFGGAAGIESFTEQRWVTIQHSGRPAYPF